ARGQSANFGAIQRGHAPLVDNGNPGIFCAAHAEPVCGEVVMNMKPVIVGQVIFLGKLDPFFGPLRRIRSMMHANAMAVMHHAAPISLGRVFSQPVFVWPFEKLWIGSQRCFVEKPITGTVVVRIGDFVDLWILEELAPGFGIHARPLYISDEALFDLDFGAREMTRMIRRASDDAIGLWRRRSWVPFLLKCRIFNDGIGKPSRR